MRSAAAFGALLCVAGLMSYAWRAAIFILWPNGPALLLRTAPKAIGLLLYPGLHLAGWIAAGFSGGGPSSYVAYLISGLIGLGLNFAVWAGLAWAALAAFNTNAEH